MSLVVNLDILDEWSRLIDLSLSKTLVQQGNKYSTNIPRYTPQHNESHTHTDTQSHNYTHSMASTIGRSDNDEQEDLEAVGWRWLGLGLSFFYIFPNIFLMSWLVFVSYLFPILSHHVTFFPCSRTTCKIGTTMTLTYQRELMTKQAPSFLQLFSFASENHVYISL